MYKALHIKNFRCFHDFTLAPLGRINLIGGKNNVGKTAVLEAVFLLAGPTNPRLNFDLHRARTAAIPLAIAPVGVLWQPIFKDFDTAQPVVVAADSDEGSRRLEIRHIRSSTFGQLQQQLLDAALPSATTTLETQPEAIEYTYTYTQGELSQPHTILVYRDKGDLRFEVQESAPNLALPIAVIAFTGTPHLSPQAADFFSKAEKDKQKDDILSALQIIEPRLLDVRLLFENGEPVFYADVGARSLMPLALIGDGLKHILRIFVNIVYASPNGIVLLDEIENGLHYSVMKDVWRALGEFSRKHQVQVFATTHSEECIRSAQEAFMDAEENEFRYHRLDRLKDGTIEAVTYDKEVFEYAVARHIEVR